MLINPSNATRKDKECRKRPENVFAGRMAPIENFILRDFSHVIMGARKQYIIEVMIL
jgi:hypothetical protein